MYDSAFVVIVFTSATSAKRFLFMSFFSRGMKKSGRGVDRMNRILLGHNGHNNFDKNSMHSTVRATALWL